MPERGVDRLGTDPAGAFRRSAAALQAAAARPGVLERSQTTAVGVATGEDRVRWRIVDLLVHGWDLARATGVTAEPPADLVEDAAHVRPGAAAGPAARRPVRRPAAGRGRRVRDRPAGGVHRPAALASTHGRGAAMTDHAVVIAGGGPTGLMLAAELTLAGVDVVVVERRTEPRARRLAGRRSARAHHRGARPARRRRAVPRRRARSCRCRGSPGSRWTSATSRPATPTGWRCGRATSSAILARLGRRARRADPARPRGRRASRRTTTASTSRCPTARRCGREYLVGCDGGRSLVRKAAGIDFPGSDPTTSWIIAEVEMDEEPELGFRRDGVGITPSAGGRPTGRPARAHRAPGRPRRRPDAGRAARGARRRLRDGLRAAQRGLDLPVHRRRPPGGRRTAAAGCCWPATPPTCTRRWAARASTSACRTP